MQLGHDTIGEEWLTGFVGFGEESSHVGFERDSRSKASLEVRFENGVSSVTRAAISFASS